MSPAIALRLRQHLTLTPQVQQALRLLQMSALEFAQEMEEALAANPFLEENTEAPPPLSGSEATAEVMLPQEPVASAPRAGFETAIPLETEERLLVVEGVSRRGNVLGRSQPIARET